MSVIIIESGALTSEHAHSLSLSLSLTTQDVRVVIVGSGALRQGIRYSPTLLLSGCVEERRMVHTQEKVYGSPWPREERHHRQRGALAS